jgi:hypothetical protein
MVKSRKFFGKAGPDGSDARNAGKGWRYGKRLCDETEPLSAPPSAPPSWSTSESRAPVLGFGEAFADAVAERLFTRLRESFEHQQRVFDLEAAAKYLGMSVDSLTKKAGLEIPVLRIDRRLRFDRRDLDRYIDQAKREWDGREYDGGG